MWKTIEAYERNRRHKEMEKHSISWIGRTNTVKMSILPKAIYTFNAILIKIAPAFFSTSNPKICMEPQKTLNSQSNVEKEIQTWRHHNPRLTNCNRQGSMILAQNRHIDQWNRIENPELDPQMYGQLIFDKAGKRIHWKKVSVTNGAGRTEQQHVEE